MSSELMRFEDFTVFSNESGKVLFKPFSISLKKHRTLAVVGESGSGKTLFSKAVLGLLPHALRSAGKMYFNNQLVDPVSSEWAKMRGKSVGLIVQNPMNVFDPLIPLGKQFIETLQAHTSLSKPLCRQKAYAALERVKLCPVKEILTYYPAQLSGGQLQRIILALTLALEPELIIADEPTTGLDASTQFDILPLFKRLTCNHTLIFITHDLALVREIADDVAVIYKNELVEYQTKENLFASPQHAYTGYLLAMRNKLNQRFKDMMR